MKSAIVYCLLLCSVALAGAGTSTTGTASDCIGENETYLNWVFNNALPKTMRYIGQLLESDFEIILPVANVSKWDTYCRELGNIRSCMVARDNAEDKRIGLAIIDKISPIVCTPEIKAKFPCLLNVSQHPSQQCQTRCQQYKSSLMAGIDEIADNDTISIDKLKAACQYVNCRVSCRKDDITSACQPTGLEAAKKLMQAVASLGQTIYQEFTRERGPGVPFPDQCSPNNVIKLT